MDKSKIRKKICQARLDVDQETFLATSNLIINKLKKRQEFIHAKTIGIYVSFNQEVNTIPFIEELLKYKTVCVPKIIGKEMNFYQIESVSQLHTGYFSILEPDSDVIIEKNTIDLLIVPVVGYDDSGNRIGYGGGYYDRYLPGYVGATIGLAFSWQKVNKIYVEKHDCPIDSIIDEKN